MNIKGNYSKKIEKKRWKKKNKRGERIYKRAFTVKNKRGMAMREILTSIIKLKKNKETKKGVKIMKKMGHDVL